MTPIEARDVIFGIFKTIWDTTGFEAIYPDKTGYLPTGEMPWARATIQHATGKQSSLSGSSGTKRFTETGIVTIQVFTPVGDGSTASYQLATLVRDAYRDALGPIVWFRDVQIHEVGISGASFQNNVLATFSYDEVR